MESGVSHCYPGRLQDRRPEDQSEARRPGTPSSRGKSRHYPNSEKANVPFFHFVLDSGPWWDCAHTLVREGHYAPVSQHSGQANTQSCPVCQVKLASSTVLTVTSLQSGERRAPYRTGRASAQFRDICLVSEARRLPGLPACG